MVFTLPSQQILKLASCPSVESRTVWNLTDRPRIKLAMPIMDEEMKQVALTALSEERLVFGESVFKFEEEFARYCRCDYAISVGSGSAALQLSLLAADLKANFRCATSSASFVSTANSILHAGGLPEFVDISPESNCIDPAQVSSVLAGCSAIMPVHLYGYPADMVRINELAGRRKLCVVEDACQAHGEHRRPEGWFVGRLWMLFILLFKEHDSSWRWRHDYDERQEGG